MMGEASLAFLPSLNAFFGEALTLMSVQGMMGEIRLGWLSFPMKLIPSEAEEGFEGFQLILVKPQQVCVCLCGKGRICWLSFPASVWF